MPLERNTFEDIYLAGFSRDVTDGLVPWIDATYPTCASATAGPSAVCRAVEPGRCTWASPAGSCLARLACTARRLSMATRTCSRSG